MDERTKAIASAAVILIVNIAGLFGITLDSNNVTQVTIGIIMLITIIYGIWKNHNFTSEAQKAQIYLNDLKTADKQGEK